MSELKNITKELYKLDDNIQMGLLQQHEAKELILDFRYSISLEFEEGSDEYITAYTVLSEVHDGFEDMFGATID